MDSKLMKMMMARKDSKKSLDPEYKDAKGGILKDLIREMSGMVGNDLKGLKKVTVAAPDENSLKAGLEKAKEMMPDSSDDEAKEESMEDPAEEAMESPEEEKMEESMEMCPECEMEHAPGEHMGMEEDPAALKAKIKELEMLLAAKGK